MCLLAAIFLFSKHAHAAVQQTDYSVFDDINSNPIASAIYIDGATLISNGITTLNSFSYVANYFYTTGSGFPTLSVLSGTNNDCTSGSISIFSGTTTAQTTNAITQHTFTITPTAVNGARFYCFDWSITNVSGSPTTYREYGSPTATVSGVVFDPNGVSNMTMPAFQINSSFDFFAVPIFTHFIDPYQPTNGTTTSSTTVNFSVPYYFDSATDYGIYDTVEIDITDITTGVTLTGFGSQPITSSGLATWTYSLGLISSHSYIWKPYFSGPTTTPLYGKTYGLSIFTNTCNTDIFQCNPAIGNQLGSTTDILAIFSLPTYVVSKVPFAYFPQVRNAILAGINATSTSIGNITYDWKFAGSTTTLTLLSSTVLNPILSDSSRANLRLIALTFLVFGFLFGLYERAKSLKII